ncbi:hypothetical protein R6Q57_009813 [Mikania cordata]
MLASFIGDDHSVTCSSPDGMYRERFVEGLSYVEFLQLFCNDWLDADVIHLFAMYFFALMPNSKCSFFNQWEISGDICTKYPDCARQHILKVYSFHSERPFFLAPYVASDHWVLFIICPFKKKGYIIDSIMKSKNKQNYAFSYLIEDALGLQLKWEMIKKYITCKEIDEMVIELSPQLFYFVFLNQT